MVNNEAPFNCPLNGRVEALECIGPPAGETFEMLTDLKVQGQLIERRVGELEQQLANGLQADVRELKNLINDIKGVIRYTFYVGRAAFVAAPVLGVAWAALAFAGVL